MLLMQDYRVQSMKPVKLFVIQLLLCAVLLSYFTAVTAETSLTAKTFVFECTDNYHFVARIENQQAWLFLPEATYKLQQLASGSVTKFGFRNMTFYLETNHSKLELSTDKSYSCVNNRAEAIWEHAKLNGTDYRGIGNEPGWTVEIHNKVEITFVEAYGSMQHTFVATAVKTDQQARTTHYYAEDGSHKLKLSIQAKPCNDSMSGKAFDSSVTLMLNEKVFRGCGRTLH